MNAEEIIKELRRYGLSTGTTLGRHMGIMDIAADKLEELNDFSGSQCAKLLAQLTETKALLRLLYADANSGHFTDCDTCYHGSGVHCGAGPCKFIWRHDTRYRVLMG